MLPRLQHLVHMSQPIGVAAFHPHVDMGKAGSDQLLHNRRPDLVGSAADLERNAAAEAGPQDFVGKSACPVACASPGRQKIVVLE
jgi:hypothetical protein